MELVSNLVYLSDALLVVLSLVAFFALEMRQQAIKQLEKLREERRELSKRIKIEDVGTGFSRSLQKQKDVSTQSPIPRSNVASTTKSQASTYAKVNRPPVAGRYFLRFIVSRKDQEAILGDLDEIYGHIIIENGTEAASRWYWWQIICTFFSVLKSKILKWGGFVLLTEVIRKFIS